MNFDKNVDFSFNEMKFSSDEGRVGEFDALLVNYKSGELAKGMFDFKENSLKCNDGKKLAMMYNHDGAIIPVGTLEGFSDDEGFKVRGKFHLSKDDKGNFINQEAAKLYSLMKDMNYKFDMSVGGAITKWKEVREAGKYSVEIEEFQAHEGSLTPKGAVKGSKVTKVFNNKSEGETMDKNEMKVMFAEMFAEFAKAQTTEDLKELPGKFAAFETKLEEGNASLKKEFNAQIEEFNSAIKEMKIKMAEGKKPVSEMEDAEFHETLGKSFSKLAENGNVNFGELLEEFAGSTTTHAAGVKPAYYNRILDRIQEENPLIKDVMFTTITDTSLTVPVEMIMEPTVNWNGEEDTRNETTAATLEDIDIKLHQVGVEPIVTNKLLGTNFLQLGQFIVMRSKEALNKSISDKFLMGTGVKQPEGILVNATVDAAAIVWDGANPDTLIEGRDAIKYDGVKAYMHRSTWTQIKTLKDSDGKYRLVDLADATAKRLLGMDVVFVDSMKSYTSAVTGEAVVLFGDTGKGMWGVRNNKLTISIEDKVTKKGFTKFYHEIGIGGAVVRPEAFQILEKA